jgi:hypothetical protein
MRVAVTLWASVMLFALGSAAAAVAQVPGSGGTSGPLPGGQIGDQLALGQGQGQTPAIAPVQQNSEPPLTATPRAQCGPGGRLEPDEQGRVPANSATQGLYCNATLVSHQGDSGGFKTWRYEDIHNHVCAFYDTALLFPVNAFKLDTSSIGVAVVDMTDPTHPVQTDLLQRAPMLSPHETLVLNAKRGLLAAALGNPDTHPGDVAIYDVHTDCRHPTLDFEGVISRLGHEAGFAPDGKTLYVAGTGMKSVTAIDVSDPRHPHDVWQGNLTSHGLSVSDNGTRVYVADSGNHEMAVLDTSQIQARKPNPQVREVSRLTWNSVSIPQNAMPFTENGHPYLLEFDEYSAGLQATGGVGAARIIDISDENHPFVVSNMRLQIDQQPDRANASGDPGMLSPLQGYAAHYCNMPTRVDPKVVACSFIASGLRVFDISNLTHPKEAAYFVAPTKAVFEDGYIPSDYAMSQPSFDVQRHDVWFTDGDSGFYVVHIADHAWPSATGAAPGGGVCTAWSGRPLRLTVRAPHGARIRRATATIAGKRIHVTVRRGMVGVVIHTNRLPRRTVVLVLRMRLRNGKVVVSRRTYHPCQSSRHKPAHHRHRRADPKARARFTG